MASFTFQRNDVGNLYRGSNMNFTTTTGRVIVCLANDMDHIIRTTINTAVVSVQVPNGPYAGNFQCDANPTNLMPPQGVEVDASVETDSTNPPGVWLHWKDGNGNVQKHGFH